MYMQNRKALRRLAKFCAYVLGHSPHEFGLVPDPDGFIQIKELLQAFREEPELRHIRQATLREMLLTLPAPPLEISGRDIRARDRQHLPTPEPVLSPPKLLFCCVRRKAHPLALQRGLFPSTHSKVLLSSRQAMARRMGRRKDASPTLLTVQVQKSIARGIVFYRYGDPLFLADRIPADCLQGPPLPKHHPDRSTPEKTAQKNPPKLAGSYMVAPDRYATPSAGTVAAPETPQGSRHKPPKVVQTEKNSAAVAHRIKKVPRYFMGAAKKHPRCSKNQLTSRNKAGSKLFRS